MKVRQGFVSNSSSTSFYIDATRHPYYKVEEAIIRMLDLLNFCNDTNYGDIGSICTISENVSRSEVSEKIKEFYGHDEAHMQLPEKIIAVDSVDDNSIPWAVQEFLCEVLGARRQHWG